MLILGTTGHYSNAYDNIITFLVRFLQYECVVTIKGFDHPCVPSVQQKKIKKIGG
jgi:hypothetical protein